MLRLLILDLGSQYSIVLVKKLIGPNKTTCPHNFNPNQHWRYVSEYHKRYSMNYLAATVS